MSDNILQFDIYKVEHNNLYNSFELDGSLMEKLRYSFLNTEKLSDKLLLAVKEANNRFDRENVDRILNCNSEVRIDYYCVKNNYIVSTFQHIYDAITKEMYLIVAITAKPLRKIGYGTLAYSKIIDDIFKVFAPDKILSTAVSTGGKKLLAKLGFMVSKRNFYKEQISVVLFNPNKTNRLERRKYKPLSKFLQKTLIPKVNNKNDGDFIEEIL